LRRSRASARDEDRRVLVVIGGAANAAIPVVARLEMCGQHLLDRVAERQINDADDPRTRPEFSKEAAGRHRGDTVDELDLAHRLQCIRSVRTVHRVTVHDYARVDVVPCPHVGQELVEQVASVAAKHRIERLREQCAARRPRGDNALGQEP